MSEAINSNQEPNEHINIVSEKLHLDRALAIAKNIILNSIDHELDQLDILKEEIKIVLFPKLNLDGIIIEDAENASSLRIMNNKSVVYREGDGEYNLPTSLLMNCIDGWKEEN